MGMDSNKNEVYYDGAAMITETDLSGRIVFANRKFSEMSGYTMDELMGKPHSIIRHSDMPKVCFQDMWDTIGEGRTWQGYVKNLRKDRKFYWVVVYISPKFQHERLCGYIAVRKKPEPEILGLVERTYYDALQLERVGLMAEALKRVEILWQRDAICFSFELFKISKVSRAL